MCGLFSWNGKNIEDFDWNKFNVLGLMNDKRGGDSCGRSFGDYELKGIDSKSDYEDLVKTYYNEALDTNSIFGHTRKASVGGVSMKNAQPITLTNDKDDIKFHLIHNGTLHNHLELAEKYGIDPVGKTDSQILANIIYDNGYAVLSEYIGAASLVFGWTETPNVIYAWRGASKMSEHMNVISDERPLHYFQESKDSIYINSLIEPLRFIGGEIAGDEPEDITVHEFDENTIYTIVDGEIADKTHISRDKCFQRKTAGYTNYSHQNNYSQRSIPASKPNPKTFNTSDIEGDEPDVGKEATSNLLYYARGRYWYNKDFAHGIYFANILGVATTAQPSNVENYEKFYFIRGIMMKDHTEFTKLAKKFKKGKRTSKHRHCEELSDFALLLSASRYPIQSWINNPRSSGFLKKNGLKLENIAGNYYTGEFNPLFTAKCYKFNQGNYTGFLGTKYNPPQSLVEAATSSAVNVSVNDVVTDAEFDLKNHGSEDDSPFISTGTNDDGVSYENIDAYQYEDSMVEDEVKTILRDIDRVIMEAKNRVEQIGPTNKTAEALDLLEELQEKIDNF